MRNRFRSTNDRGLGVTWWEHDSSTKENPIISLIPIWKKTYEYPFIFSSDEPTPNVKCYMTYEAFERIENIPRPPNSICCNEVFHYNDKIIEAKAERKGRKTLKRHLSQEEWHEYQKNGYFHIKKEKRLYRIGKEKGSWSKIKTVKNSDSKEYIESFCIHAKYEKEIYLDYPDSDYLLSFKLMIEADERKFRRIANITFGKDHPKFKSEESVVSSTEPEDILIDNALMGLTEQPIHLMEKRLVQENMWRVRTQLRWDLRNLRRSQLLLAS